MTTKTARKVNPHIGSDCDGFLRGYAGASSAAIARSVTLARKAHSQFRKGRSY